jgi:LPS-assembly lipoprotein
MALISSRRQWLSTVAPAALLLGCGFELRRVPELQFSTIAFTGFAPRSLMLEELKLNFGGSKTTAAVDSAAQAQVVFEALHDARERVTSASNSFGLVQSFQLRVRLKYLVRTPSGVLLQAPAELLLVRDMSYNESQALAKEQEEAQLYRVMQSDIVAQVMRRLATVKLPGSY